MPKYLAKYTAPRLNLDGHDWYETRVSEEYRFEAEDAEEALAKAEEHRLKLRLTEKPGSSMPTLDELLRIEEVEIKDLSP